LNILIKNGWIFDGTGKNSFLGSIIIEGNKIKKVIKGDEKVDSEKFEKIIDAKGKVISPGFIDTHSHSDVEIMIDSYIEPKIRQGITTEILGQDGIAVAPLPIEYISTWRKNIAGLSGDSDNINWEFKTVDGYLKQLEKGGVGHNIGYLIPHGNVRMEAMGLDNKEPSEADLEKMRDIIRREMRAGAYGLSTGLIYSPCCYAKTEEIIELCKIVAEFDGVFVVHQRREDEYGILESMDELIRIGEESGVKVHISHMKICGTKNPDIIKDVLGKIEEFEKRNIQITFDQYPYVAGSTMLAVILPPWVHDGGTKKLLKRLESKEMREKIIHEIKNHDQKWDNFIDFAGLDNIFITSVKTKKNEDLIGKNLLEVGEIRGKDPYHAAFDLLVEENNAVGMYDIYGKEEHVKEFMKHPNQNVCTDGLLGGKPHPRVYGSFPRVLGKYVREEKIISLEKMIAKMTGNPAKTFGIKDRGLLKRGDGSRYCCI
jgi:N-acyl-D-amino-acid deacylase